MTARPADRSVVVVLGLVDVLLNVHLWTIRADRTGTCLACTTLVGTGYTHARINMTINASMFLNALATLEGMGYTHALMDVTINASLFFERSRCTHDDILAGPSRPTSDRRDAGGGRNGVHLFVRRGELLR